MGLMHGFASIRMSAPNQIHTLGLYHTAARQSAPGKQLLVGCKGHYFASPPVATVCELDELTGGGGETGMGGGGKTGLGGGNKTGLGGGDKTGLGGGNEAGLGGGGEGEVTLVPAHMANSVSPDSWHMNYIAVGS